MSVGSDVQVAPQRGPTDLTGAPIVRRERPLHRAARVARLEFGYHMRRPLVLMLILLLGLTSWGLTTGNMQISTGDQSVGGKRAFITSEHSNALTLCLVVFLFYTFFGAVVAGTAVPRDEELKVGEVLHSTGLRPREYVWGKMAGIMAAFGVVMALQLVLMMVVYHVLPYENADRIRGPFALGNYLRPALWFGLPQMLFVLGVSFWLGERTRRPILVFLFPVALMVVVGFFLWSWSPGWLDPRIERFLQWIEPTGYRWLNEAHLEVDRGVDYYNTQPVRIDAHLVGSRLLLVLASLTAVWAAERHFARNLRGAHRLGRRERAALDGAAAGGVALTRPGDNGNGRESAPLAGLGMRRVARGFLTQAWTIARFELRNLAGSAGLYLFAPLILLQVIQAGIYAESLWDTLLIATPGSFAMQTMNTLTLTIVLLLLFYTVESFDRERQTGVLPIYSSTPVRTGAILFGKALANCFVAVVILAAAWLGCLVTLLVQRKVGMDLRPFLVIWGLLLVPTFLLWSSFVMAVMALTGNRYATYAIGLAALGVTGLAQTRGKMSWAWNWNLWSAVRWSDLGFLEPNGLALLLNRLMALGASIFFIAFTVRVLARREWDSTRTVHRLAPARLGRGALRLAPYALAPVGLSIALGMLVWQGHEGRAARKRERDYWKKNLATWAQAPIPGTVAVDLDLDFEPERHSLRSSGTYTLVNVEPQPMRQVALTLAPHIRAATWTMNGQDYEPENRASLYVFTPPQPLAPGDSLRIGFRYDTRWPDGINKNGGGMPEFIEPSGVVLTGFRPIMAPVVGWMEEIGVEERENRYEPRVYPDDHWKDIVHAGFNIRTPFTTRMRLQGPQEYTLNGPGTLVEDRVEGDRRISTWVSDHPLKLTNAVAGRWAVREGQGTALYYHPGHDYNVDEMVRALDASRRYYSEWFYPFPWKTLKVSEFANLAHYAQGFATNITFSEGIGFLTLSNARSKLAFVVTAHEAAHQWWGNLMTPGDGPGGNLLSEGMAHYSTLLLMEQMHGLQGRMEFAKRIEDRYNDRRQLDAERPLVRIDGSRAGDQTVMYDKGGWVFWMLHDFMGREACLAGLQAFVRNHVANPDHPLLEDFVAEMRPFAADSTAYDAFTRQWFFEVVVPEYQFEDVKHAQQGGRWVVTGTLRNVGSGRMPVDIAATRGERFEKQTEAQALEGPAPVSKDYQEARTQLVLAAGEAAPFRIECGFEPESVATDPDARVLQLRRKTAMERL